MQLEVPSGSLLRSLLHNPKEEEEEEADEDEEIEEEAEEDDYCAEQKTLLFDVREANTQQRRFIGVTVGQSIDEAGGPSKIWMKIKTDYEYHQWMYARHSANRHVAPDFTWCGLFLHWGLSAPSQTTWELPKENLPTGSVVWNNCAIRSPLIPVIGGGSRCCTFDFGPVSSCPLAVEFVLWSCLSNAYSKSGDLNFSVPVQRILAEIQMAKVRKEILKDSTTLVNLGRSQFYGRQCTAPDVHHIYELPREGCIWQLDVAIWTSEESVVIEVFTNLKEVLFIHWGFVNFVHEEPKWERADPRLHPPNSVTVGTHGVETPFQRGLYGLQASLIQTVRLVFPNEVIFETCVETLVKTRGAEDSKELMMAQLQDPSLATSAFPHRLAFVLRSADGGWIHNDDGAQDCFMQCEWRPLTLTAAAASSPNMSHVVHHGKHALQPPPGPAFGLVEVMYSSPVSMNRNFEVSIPFSDAFRVKLFQYLEELKTVDLHSSRLEITELPITTPEAAYKPSPDLPFSYFSSMANPPLPGNVLCFEVEGSIGMVHATVVEDFERGRIEVEISTTLPSTILHWGVINRHYEDCWQRPDPSMWPENTILVGDDNAVETPLLSSVKILIPRKRVLSRPNNNEVVVGIAFVLRTAQNKWIKYLNGQDFCIKIHRAQYPPEVLARQWRGPHFNLVARLLQIELNDDIPLNRYATLQQILGAQQFDKLDVDFWAWLLIWWRLAHLRVFRRHAHSRPWDVSDAALRVSVLLISHWRAAPRARPIIRLLTRHMLCWVAWKDIRADLYSILKDWNLLVFPFYDNWYRKVYQEVGMEDFVICKGLIAMLKNLSVLAYWDVMNFYGYTRIEGIQADPVIPPTFTFLQTLTQYASRYGFIKKHVELESKDLDLLVNRLKGLANQLQTLFFGVHTCVASQYAQSSLTRDLNGIFKEIEELQNEDFCSPTNCWHLFDLCASGRSLISPNLIHCTDSNLVREFMFADLALDNLQQKCLADLYGFTGIFIEQGKNAERLLCSHCQQRHVNSANPLAVLMAPLEEKRCTVWEAEIIEKYFLKILSPLLLGLRVFYPSADESTAMINDWGVFLHHTSSPSQLQFLFLCSFFLRIQRCVSRIVDLCLVYLTDKVKFLAQCLASDCVLSGRLESFCNPPTPPRVLTTADPLLSPCNVAECSPPNTAEERLNKEVSKFLSDLFLNSAIFWIVHTLNRLAPLLRVSLWTMHSSVTYASASAILVFDGSLEDAVSKMPHATESLLLVARSASGGEMLPANVRALVVGPQAPANAIRRTIVPLAISPLALAARQRSVLFATCICGDAFDAFWEEMQEFGTANMEINIFVAPDQNSLYVWERKTTAVTSGARFPSMSNFPLHPLVVDNESTDDELLLSDDDDQTAEPFQVSPVLPLQRMTPVLPNLRSFCCEEELDLEGDGLSFKRRRQLSSSKLFDSFIHGASGGGGVGDAESEGCANNELPVISMKLFRKLYTLPVRWLLSYEHFQPLLVGKLSMGFRKLKETLTDYLFVPTVVVPFGVLELTLQENMMLSQRLASLLLDLERLKYKRSLLLCEEDPSLAAIAEVDDELQSSTSSASVHHPSASSMNQGGSFSSFSIQQSMLDKRAERLLAECRTLIRGLRMPTEMLRMLQEYKDSTPTDASEDMNIIIRGMRIDKFWISLKNVWCSLFTPTVWQASHALGFTFGTLRVAVRVQLLPETPAYTFLLHCNLTEHDEATNPWIGYNDLVAVTEKDETFKVYGEVTTGLQLQPGELFSGGHLVSGRPLSFVGCSGMQQQEKESTKDHEEETDKERSNSSEDLDSPSSVLRSSLQKSRDELMMTPRVRSFILPQQQPPVLATTKLLALSSSSSVLKLRRPGIVLKPEPNFHGIEKFLSPGGLVSCTIDSPSRARFEMQKDPLYADHRWRTTVLERLTEVAAFVESHVGTAFIIEGAITNAVITNSEFSIAISGTSFCKHETRRHKILITGGIPCRD